MHYHPRCPHTEYAPEGIASMNRSWSQDVPLPQKCARQRLGTRLSAQMILQGQSLEQPLSKCSRPVQKCCLLHLGSALQDAYILVVGDATVLSQQFLASAVDDTCNTNRGPTTEASCAHAPWEVSSQRLSSMASFELLFSSSPPYISLFGLPWCLHLPGPPCS